MIYLKVNKNKKLIASQPSCIYVSENNFDGIIVSCANPIVNNDISDYNLSLHLFSGNVEIIKPLTISNLEDDVIEFTPVLIGSELVSTSGVITLYIQFEKNDIIGKTNAVEITVNCNISNRLPISSDNCIFNITQITTGSSSYLAGDYISIDSNIISCNIESITNNLQGEFLPLSRQVAGLPLSQDISAESLKTALDIPEEDIDLSDYVQGDRTVAGLNLSQDISAQSLKTALDIDENAVADFAATAIPNYLKWEQGYIDASGINSTTAGYYRTDYISIDNAFKYYLFLKNLSENQGIVRYFQYDENREYIAKININVAASNQTTALMNTGNAAYIRLLCSDNLDRESARVYCNEQIATVSKQQLKDLTDGMPKKLEPQNEYFCPNSRIVLVGDSITQGFGSTGLVSYSKSEDGVTVNIKGNGPEYGVLHNLRTYRYGKKLWQNGTSTITRWYEALDGSGWAHKFKNYVQNRYGCTVSNYGMSGITTGHLISNMSSENSDLLTVSDGTLSVIQGLAKNADVVILMIGTNDRGYANISAFTTNLNTIVTSLTDSGKKVILMTSIPAADDNVQNISMAQINAATKEYAQTNNILHISLYEKMMAYISMADITLSEVTKADGIHPNDYGYEIMYTLLLDALCMNTADQSFVNSAITAAVGNVESLLEALL